MARYLSIVAVDRPQYVSLDAAHWAFVVCNYRAEVAGRASALSEEIRARLIALGLTTAANTFIGPGSYKPSSGSGPFVTVISSGGLPALETHNGSIYDRASFQIAVRAESGKVAQDLADAIYAALDGSRNLTLSA